MCRHMTTWTKSANRSVKVVNLKYFEWYKESLTFSVHKQPFILFASVATHGHFASIYSYILLRSTFDLVASRKKELSDRLPSDNDSRDGVGTWQQRRRLDCLSAGIRLASLSLYAVQLIYVSMHATSCLINLCLLC
jgi:hypothetical protein